MEKYNVRIKKLDENAIIPTYGSPFAAGADLYASVDEPVTVEAGETKLVPTGFAFEIPEGYAGFVYARSGLASKRNLAPANKVGVIDSDYRGEFIVVLHNHGDAPQTVSSGERIAQLLVVPVLMTGFAECDTLDDTERAAGGFGSTGK